MRDQRTKKLLIAFFIVNTILFGMCGFLIYSVESKNKKTSALYAASEQQVSDQEKIQNLKQILKETEGDRKKLDEYFITKTNTVSFIEKMKQVSRDASVDLSINSISDGEKNTDGVSLGFSAKGSFSSLYRLIVLVELMPYKITFKKIDIQKTDILGEWTKGWNGNFIITLESFIATNQQK